MSPASTSHRPPDLAAAAASHGVPIGAEERLRTAKANLDALGDRAADLGAALDAWARRLDDEAWFRTREGDIHRQRVSDGVWIHRAADRALAESIPLPADILSGDLQRSRPVTIEGISPPWLFLRIAAATPPTQNGHRPRLQIVQADAHEFLDGLACADMTAVLADDRVRVFVGPDASARLRADLDARFDTIIAGPLLRNPALRTPATPAIEQTIAEAARAQGDEQERLTRRVAAAYAPRDVAWWRRRYDEALFGDGKPLRVLIPTCRYSTFVRHSAEDIAEAVRAAGHEARVVVEPDESSRLSSVAYTRAFAEFDPDLVILINYTRASLGPAGTPRVPFVCWVQDAMPQLFSSAAGAAQTDLDFVVGHVQPSHLSGFGYSARRMRRLGVPVCPRKFHAGAIDTERRRRFECEIAYVGHQSEPPEAFHERMIRASAGSPGAVAIMQALRPRVLAAAAGAGETSAHAALVDAVRAEIRTLSGREPDDATTALILHQYAMPLADLALRHETLGWAAAIAERRGWRFKVFGRGWDAHPTLARHAAGRVEHGEDLRACYRAAGAHLHASIRNVVHQRPVECALSGGLALARFTMDERHMTWIWAMAQVARDTPADFCTLADRCESWLFTSHPRLMDFYTLRQRIGMKQAYAAKMEPWMLESIRRDGAPEDEQIAHWLFCGLDEATFTNEASLEARLVRAVERPAWRASLSSSIARRAGERLTTDASIARLLAFVRAGLGQETPPCS